jgi:hypothetical protein
MSEELRITYIILLLELLQDDLSPLAIVQLEIELSDQTSHARLISVSLCDKFVDFFLGSIDVQDYRILLGVKLSDSLNKSSLELLLLKS